MKKETLLIAAYYSGKFLTKKYRYRDIESYLN